MDLTAISRSGIVVVELAMCNASCVMGTAIMIRRFVVCKVRCRIHLSAGTDLIYTHLALIVYRADCLRNYLQPLEAPSQSNTRIPFSDKAVSPRTGNSDLLRAS